MSETTTTIATTDQPTRTRGVARTVQPPGIHWVGDGFRVHSMFPGGADLTEELSPFLMMDYHPPFEYEPTDTPRGVGVHPHRGFETVTIAFEGSVAHHDSTGTGGVINAGDVQWMTAAGGILHKEYHEAEWAKRGGTFHMMQLWVNLPAANKMDDPTYQGLTADQMGEVDLPNGQVSVIAGGLDGVTGPAHTHTPVALWEAKFDAAGTFSATLPESHNLAVMNLVTSELTVFDHDGDGFSVDVEAGDHLMVLAGEPIDEPVASYGPFVMNTTAELQQAVNDFNSGKFGHLV